MFGSVKIGRALGIDIFVHGTFWLLPLLVVLGGSGDAGFDLALLFAVFGCVALHELGHAAAAKLYGIRTRDITLYPIGGVARLERMPATAWPELVIALAGPAVNVAIAIGLGALLFAVGALQGPSAWDEPGVGVAFLAVLLQANVFLVLFNLIPAFPMDGGRVLRAVMQLFSNRLVATRVAATVGAGVSGLLLLYALFGTTSVQPMLAVLAMMVFVMGQAELAMVRREATPFDWPASHRPNSGIDDPDPTDYAPRPPRVAVARPIDGWSYDDCLRAWVEYRDGRPVRVWRRGE